MKKILLIGDSICQGYRDFVKIAFKDTAEVYFPETNCSFEAYDVAIRLSRKAYTARLSGCGYSPRSLAKATDAYK